jgi:transposase-like protein
LTPGIECPRYAAKLKCRRPKLGDKLFLNEVPLKINGVQHYPWHAVDQHGAVIDILVQPKRDRFAAMRFFRKLSLSAGKANKFSLGGAKVLFRLWQEYPDGFARFLARIHPRSCSLPRDIPARLAYTGRVNVERGPL